jgi:exopolyphosphatase/pppGpp-phosphohydrolase
MFNVLRVFVLFVSIVVIGQESWAAEQATLPSSQPRNFGAIDLGSRGVKAYLYSFVREGEGIDARTDYKNSINTKLVSGALDGKLTSAGITEATQAVVKLLAEMKADAAKRNLPKVEYYIVGSSGVAQFPNHNELKQMVDHETGLSMNFVDASQEGYYGLLSAIPKVRRPVAVSVDIGSGNTKIACLTNGKPETSEIPFGSVTLRNAVLSKTANEAEYSVGLKSILDQQVRPTVTGCGAERPRVYWIGGAAWATATFTHPERALWGYVPLTRTDIDTFLKKLQDKTWNQGEPRFDFAADVTPAQRSAATKAGTADRQQVMNVFSREDLLAGVSLMKTILDKHSNPATLYFVRNGNYVFGYALEKFSEESDKSSSATANVDSASYFAGIDLGSRGVKAFIYSFVHEGEGVDARVIFKDTVNTKLVSGAKDKRFTPDGIEEAKSAVVKLVGEMRAVAEQKAIKPRFYIVASSGVAAFENRGDLKSVVDSATGLELEFVDAKTEALDALLSAVPPTRRQEGIVVDIGSGNTKLGCMTADVFNPVEIPYGTVTLRKSVPADKEYFAGLQESLNKVTSAYKVERMNTPCLGSRTRIYFVGGAPWATATFSRPEAALWGYVPLARKDIDAFLQRLRNGKWNQDVPRYNFEPKVSISKQEAIKKANLSDRDAVQNVFAQEDLLAGVSLIRMILDNSNQSAHVFFVRNGNYLYGYALDKFKDIKIGEDVAGANSTH